MRISTRCWLEAMAMRHPKSWTHFDYGMITWRVLRLRISPTDSVGLRPESDQVRPDVRQTSARVPSGPAGLRRTAVDVGRILTSPTGLRSDPIGPDRTSGGVRRSPPDVRYDPRTYFDDSRTQSFYLKSESDFNESDSSPTGSDQTPLKPEFAASTTEKVRPDSIGPVKN